MSDQAKAGTKLAAAALLLYAISASTGVRPRRGEAAGTDQGTASPDQQGPANPEQTGGGLVTVTDQNDDPRDARSASVIGQASANAL
jgi:hypothetical protein